MKIWIVSSGVSPTTYYLSEDPLLTLKENVASELEISAERTVQITKRFRATNQSVRNRKNLGYSISFTVRRLFTSNAAASSFMFDHAEAVPGDGTLYWQTTEGGPGVKRSLSNAVIQSLKSKQVGQTTYHTYSVVGSQIATAT